jgi:hypothetical protein
MIPERLRDLVLAVAAIKGDTFQETFDLRRTAFDRLSRADRAALMQFMRDHYPDERSEQLTSALAAMPTGVGAARERLSGADQDRVWALFIQTLHPPGLWSHEEMCGGSSS